MSIILKAYGKLNLTLNVMGMFDRQYHRLSSVLTTVSVFDTVSVTKRQDKQVIVTIDGVPTQDNAAFSVGCAIVSAYNTNGVDIEVVKGITRCGGMGGSSVAASATINAMSSLYGIPMDTSMLRLAAQHGSDIAYLIRGGLALAMGKGDDIMFVDCDSVFHFCIIEGYPLTTTAVFKQYDVQPDVTAHSNEKLLDRLLADDIVGARSHLGNNLQAAAIRLQPKLCDVINAGSRLSLPLPCMTGSGGNFFILAKSDKEAAKFADKLSEQGFKAFTARSVAGGMELI